MSKYASLLFSPTKYHNIGPFRFPVYEDLIPGESKKIEEYSRQQSRSTLRSLKLAKKIAQDRNITTKEAVELLSKTDENEDLLYDYAAELEEAQNSGAGAVEQKIAFVTLFMKYRAEVMLPKSKEWTQLNDWSDQDTEQMPSKLLEAVFQLLMWEKDGWPEPEGKSSNTENHETVSTI